MMLFGYEQGKDSIVVCCRLKLSICKGVFGGIMVGQDFIEYFNHPSPAMQGFMTSVYGESLLHRLMITH